MKKNYITPKINVVQFEALCSGGLATCSVYRESLDKECISNFEVLDEDKIKTDTKYQNLWGESNSGNWGDD